MPVQEILSIKLLSTVSKKKGLVTVECAPLHKQEEEGVVASMLGSPLTLR